MSITECSIKTDKVRTVFKIQNRRAHKDPIKTHLCLHSTAPFYTLCGTSFSITTHKVINNCRINSCRPEGVICKKCFEVYKNGDFQRETDKATEPKTFYVAFGNELVTDTEMHSSLHDMLEELRSEWPDDEILEMIESGEILIYKCKCWPITVEPVVETTAKLIDLKEG